MHTENVRALRRNQRIEKVTELVVWLVLLLIVFGVQLVPRDMIGIEYSYLLAGGMISLSLFSYYLIWKMFDREEDRFLKDLADVIFLVLVVFIAKEFHTEGFALFILPVAAAAFALDLFHSLAIASTTAVLIAAEMLLVQQGALSGNLLTLSSGQIAGLIVLLVFIRLLALGYRHERIRHSHSLAAVSRSEAATVIEPTFQPAVHRLATHKLQTPLADIEQTTDKLLNSRTKLSAASRKAINEIQANARHLKEMLTEE